MPRITYSPISRELWKRRTGHVGGTDGGADMAATECIEDAVGDLNGFRRLI
jgi:hypothetical protein